MKKTPVISFVSLLMFAAAPCSSQKAQAPLSAAAAQSKKQDQRPQFTHADAVQFVHTVQTEALNWKETISSVDPSVFHFDDKATTLVEKEKKTLLLVLDRIGRLSLPASEKNAATDLGVEFVAYEFLVEIWSGAESLSHTLVYNSIDSEAKAGELLQVRMEAQKAQVALFGEILTRIANIARSEKAGGCQ
jgi:hypothetical protein